MLRYGKFAHVDLEFINGVIPENDHYHEWMSGPDSFEIEIGNYFAYSVPLLTNDDYFETLKSGRLPYYTEDIRRRRLAMVKKYCINNLEHIEPYVRRGLYFQAFDRFYNAFREFLQALFISKRTYPICYEKWIKEQIVDILGLPELYTEILSFFHIDSLESDKMIENMKKMYGLMDKYILIE